MVDFSNSRFLNIDLQSDKEKQVIAVYICLQTSDGRYLPCMGL